MKQENTLKSLSLLQKILIIISAILLVIFVSPVIIILAVGMLPSITAVMTSKKDKNKVIAISCFNIAGVFFYLLKLINNFSNEEAFRIVTDVFSLIAMFGSAALGLLFYYELPTLFAYISKVSAKRRLKYIDGKIEKLREEWGDEIVSETSSAIEKTSK